MALCKTLLTLGRSTPCFFAQASGSLAFEPKQLNDVLLPKNAHRSVSLFVGVLQGWPPWQPLDGNQQIKGRQPGGWRPRGFHAKGVKEVSCVIAHHNYTTHRGLRSKTKAILR